MTIEDLRRRFLYTKDGIDSWRILKNPTGPLQGDCDDFAVTALWIAEGKSMLRFWWALWTGRATIWRVQGRTTQPSHAVLEHKVYGWIDNQNPTWGPNRDVLVRRRYFPECVVKMLKGLVLK